MARLGPWDGGRRVAVAVSGGADSLALALLTAAWGSPTAFIVDHGLRPESAAEAEQTRALLAGRAIPSHVLTLDGLRPGPGLPARARAGRYAALEAATAAAGLVDLLLGHHAGDQAETVLMRQDRGSGPRGLAGMAGVTEGALVRRVRPLLAVHPGQLRATLRTAGVTWIEDPTNQDPSYTRARLRVRMGGAPGALAAAAAHHARDRRAADGAIARILAVRASLYPQGYAILTPGPIEPQALAALLQALSGRPFAPPLAAVAALAQSLRPATLGGVRVMAAGRLGPGWLLVREAAAMAPPVPLQPGAAWDGRYRVVKSPQLAPATLGGVGAKTAVFRHSGLPAAVICALPALRGDGMLSVFTGCTYIGEISRGSEIILRHDGSPACGAAFQA